MRHSFAIELWQQCVGGVTGKFGNTLDAKASKDVVADSDSGDSGSDSDAEAGEGARKSLMQRKKREEAEICRSYSVTEPLCMKRMNRSYGYISISNSKPCLYVISMFEDFRKRHFHCNILNRIYNDLVAIVYHLLFIVTCLWNQFSSFSFR